MVYRRPKDISTLVANQTGNELIKIDSSSSNLSKSVQVLWDSRPSYTYGTRGKIGSRVWVYPTPYTHICRTIKLIGTASRKQKSGSLMLQHDLNVPDIESYITNHGWPLGYTQAQPESNSRSEAQVKALNSLAQNKAGIGEDLATFAQTARMFLHSASLLHNALNIVKQSKSLSQYLKYTASDLRKSGAKGAAGAYLEYVYGWKPLVSDVYGVYQLLQEYASGIRPIIVHGHGVSKYDNTSTLDFPSPGSWSWYISDSQIKVTSKTTCDLYARVDPSTMALRALNQLGLLNPASIAWDVIPWSFVVDWLIPIGPVLEALTAMVGLIFISGTTSQRKKITYQGMVHTTCAANSSNILSDVPMGFEVLDDKYVRERHLTPPVPMAYINLNPLSGDRAFKALALAIANLRS